MPENRSIDPPVNLPSNRQKPVFEHALMRLIHFTARQLFKPWSARILFVLLLMTFATVAYIQPIYAWDGLAYMAIAVEDNFTTPAALHQFIFESVKQTVSADGWQRLVHLEAYHEAQFANADNFSSMLGFYRMRIAYIGLVGHVAKITGIVYAPWIIGAVFGLASLVLFYFTLVKIGMERYFALTIPLLLASELPRLVRLPTPDAMSCFLLLLGLYLYVFHARSASYIAWALAILTRPDNLVFLIALLIVQILRRDMRRWDWIGLVASALCYIWATAHTGHMGWWTHFYFANIGLSMNMNDFNVPFSIGLYLRAVLFETIKMIYMASWFHMYLAVLLTYAYLKTRLASRAVANWSADIWDGVIIMTLLAVAARLVVFPHMRGSLLAPMVLIAGLALMAKLRTHWYPVQKQLIV